MDARSLLPLFDSAQVLALAAWAGILLAMTFVTAPALTSALDEPSALRLVRVLLPRAYAGCALSGSVALPSYVAVPLSFPDLRGPTVAAHAVLILAGIGLMFYGGNGLVPARDPGPGRVVSLSAILRRAALLNGISLVIVAVLLVSFAVRPAPVTPGLADPSPEAWAERSVRSFEAKQRAYERSRQVPPRPQQEQAPR